MDTSSAEHLLNSTLASIRASWDQSEVEQQPFSTTFLQNVDDPASMSLEKFKKLRGTYGTGSRPYSAVPLAVSGGRRLGPLRHSKKRRRRPKSGFARPQSRGSRNAATGSKFRTRRNEGGQTIKTSASSDTLRIRKLHRKLDSSPYRTLSSSERNYRKPKGWHPTTLSREIPDDFFDAGYEFYDFEELRREQAALRK